MKAPILLCLVSVSLLGALVSCSTPGAMKSKKQNATIATALPQGGLDSPNWNHAAGNGPLPKSVGNKATYFSINTSQPVLALTFDDGPHPVHTPRLLDILKSRNVRATFYVVAPNARRYPAIMQRMIAEGHEIGNHTITHGNLAKMSAAGVRRELNGGRDAIVATTGIQPVTMRPPYGAITSNQKQWIRSEFGYPSIMWSCDPEDWKKPGVSVVTNRLVAGARPGAILLAHDIHKSTIDSVPAALDRILAKGLRFVTVTELIAMEGR